MRICVCLGMSDLEESLVRAKQLKGKADVIEVRLDLLSEPAVTPFLHGLQTPLLFTNRPEWEGGKFHGEERQRLAPMLEAARNGADYIDLEIRAAGDSWKTMLEVCADTKTKLISSWHDFKETPGLQELIALVQKMKDSGANIGKIVTTAQCSHDVLTLFQLLEGAQEMDFPLIAFAMGDIGKISRVAAPALHGYMTYCSADQGEGTAPGQITISEMQDIFRIVYS